MLEVGKGGQAASMLLALMALGGAAPSRVSTPQVFAYTPNLVLDLNRNIEVYGEGHRAALSDCSVGDLKCVSAYYVKVAWKQECNQQKGDVTTVGGVRSEVRETYMAKGHYASSQVAIVVTEGMPDAAYLIRDGGLIGVIIDHSRSGELGGKIYDGTVSRALEAGQLRPTFGTVNRLLTLDSLGNCRDRQSSAQLA